MAVISRNALEFALGVSRELYPREFMGLLRGKGDEIAEIIILPATLWGEGFAEIHGMHVPMDKSIIGSIHSHPSQSNRPSKQDLMEFGRSGNIHLILRHPYHSIRDVACFSTDGGTLDITVWD
ncbi:MAG: Mov34/MPN/PAD-1 family protein [Candidatus Altiarchaeota archaeon]